MPYADEAQQRQAQRDWWRAKYEGNPAFRRKELRRKKAARAAWTPKRKKQDRDYMREFMRKYRAKLKKKKALEGAKNTGRPAKTAVRLPKRGSGVVKPAARKLKSPVRATKAPAKAIKRASRTTPTARAPKKAVLKRAASRRRG